eukprot:2677709-Pyramimonas_sp.AAC.2
MPRACPHCSAKLFQCEGDGFRCGGGKHYVDMSRYYKTPAGALLDLFRTARLCKDQQGRPAHDPTTNGPRLTGFSAISRRCNSLLSFAAHEIQNTTSENELRFGNELRPSNIRIHVAMYWRIWSCADTTPARYIVVDPRERGTGATAQNVDIRLVRRLERLILPHNTNI